MYARTTSTIAEPLKTFLKEKKKIQMMLLLQMKVKKIWNPFENMLIHA